MQVRGEDMMVDSNGLTDDGARRRSGIRLTVLILGFIALGFFASAFLMLAI